MPYSCSVSGYSIIIAANDTIAPFNEISFQINNIINPSSTIV